MGAIRRLANLCTGMVSAMLAGCALLTPLPRETTLAERLAAIPTSGAPIDDRVVIYWNDRQVPFIEAKTDADAAFTLGLVHAHLRLGQMEIFRRISQGRLSEIGGPLATDIDHSLRILNFGRAAAEIERKLPERTRSWVKSYVAGINHYLTQVQDLPHEFAVLGMAREKWTVRDVLTVGRLAGTDVNWLVWFGMLKLRDRADWPRLWARLVRHGGASIPSFEKGASHAALEQILAASGKSGSNSLAVAPARSETGAALIANDPHLGITLPNLWLIAGLKSPSYHVVGLMAPGLPIFAIGRNESIAWGGTNMRAASSDLYEVSDLSDGDFKTRKETIGVRWWFDRDVTIRESKWGPVLSDAPVLKDAGLPPTALRWAGHRYSDELGAMLAVSRARDFAEFRNAFRSFAVSGQNMVYADTAGNIGQVMAVQLPARDSEPPKDIVVDRRDGDAAWRRMVDVTDLPFSLNPEKGYLISANNRPSAAPVPLGYFFSPDDRMIRVNDIMTHSGKISLANVQNIQRDVFMASSVALRDVYLHRLAPLITARDAKTRAAVELLRRWDGHYRADSRGAVAFELFHSAFKHEFYRNTHGEEDGAVLAIFARTREMLHEDIAVADATVLRRAMNAGLDTLAEKIDAFSNWGAMHRLRIAHPLQLLPLIGGRYRFADLPVGGSSATLMKTAHAPTDSRHATRYGSNARHVSDMSDMDRNYFALLGGQDGWINSANFIDQVADWQKGRYITVPMRMDNVRARFKRRTVLEPGG